jgi:hypothetical protein
MENNTRWYEFNSIIDSKDLDIKEKGLLLIIFRYINHRTRYADPSRILIKKLTDISDNRTLDKIFDSLIEKGLLRRESGKGKRSKYFIRVGGEITPSVKAEPSEEITPKVGGKVTPRVGVNITPQKENKRKVKEKIYIDLTFIDDVIDKVKITQEQYDKLVNKFATELTNNQIIALDNYIANGKGTKYKDHYRALNKWCNDKVPKVISGQMNIDDDGIRDF